MQIVNQSLQLQHFTLNESLIKYVIPVLVYLVNYGNSKKLSVAGPAKYSINLWQGYYSGIISNPNNAVSLTPTVQVKQKGGHHICIEISKYLTSRQVKHAMILWGIGAIQ